MHLHRLLRQLWQDIPLDGLPDVEVRRVCEDSRRVQPGDLFVARGGTRTDGCRFLAEAQARGAVAALVPGLVADCSLPQVVCADPASAGSMLAHVLAGQPTRSLRLLGITGTNGKTTTAYLVRHILHSAGMKCGMIGTVQIDDGQQCRPADMTTPAGPELAELLAAMRDHGCQACAMEVSSHALDQGRVAGIHFAAAAFTNLTGDHLDYHGTMANYAQAKARLFQMLDGQGIAVVNADDRWSDRITGGCRARVVRFGIDRPAQYRATDIRIGAEGSEFNLLCPRGQVPIRTRLIGRHNVANTLTAAALVAETFDLSLSQIASAMQTATGAPGRLQSVRCGQPFTVLVDYAHTDDALENVLAALRPLTQNKLRVLFGCGGDRDRSKRPRMAAVAERLADVIYLTSDNPRTENPQAIIDEVLAGFSADVRLCGAVPGSAAQDLSTGKAVFVQPDRRLAIQQALNDACAGDIVLLAGKGHENYQILGTEKRHFDDVEEATRLLSRYKAAT